MIEKSMSIDKRLYDSEEFDPTKTDPKTEASIESNNDRLNIENEVRNQEVQDRAFKMPKDQEEREQYIQDEEDLKKIKAVEAEIKEET